MVKVEGRDKGYESDVCSFRFVNLRRAGNLSLVLSLDNGGRAGCGQVTIIDRTASGYVGYDGAFTSAMGVDDVSAVVRDVNHDGVLYLVFDQQFATEGMWSMFASWPMIYGWNGTEYSNLSFDRRFRWLLPATDRINADRDRRT